MKSHSTACVTGASTGLGYEFALQLAETRNLIIVARDKDRLNKLKTRLEATTPASVEVFAADLTEAAQCSALAENLSQNENLDLLVNNAGFGTVGDFTLSDRSKEVKQVDLNVRALVELTHAALSTMRKKRRGAVINVSSVAGFQPSAYSAVYSASKSFVRLFSEAVNDENREYNIRVQTLCPGFTRTEFQQRAGIPVEDVPDFAWMQSSDVVRISLEKLSTGDTVVVPGILNEAVVRLSSLLPEQMRKDLTSTVMKRLK